MKTVRVSTAQALITFLRRQQVERDGVRRRFFAGCFGIFGHGNVAGIGQALKEQPELPYFQARNEQAMVHAAAAYAKMSNRLQTLVCTTSIGPGATNMITAAAGATINRLPVLLLPGDVFASRANDPVLQQLESPVTRDVSVNDCFRPVSRYWDRIWRPEQLPSALMDAMRVLTSPADTGAVTLCLPQDVQAEAWEFPAALLDERVWTMHRQPPAPAALAEAAALIRGAARPMLIAGGGVIYAEATDALKRFVEATGVPSAETQAGRGALPWDHPQNLGAMGVTGSLAANVVARDADLIIGVGTRYSDFTTASQTAFADPAVRFVNVNVAELDALKQGAVQVVADARSTLEALTEALAGHHIEPEYAASIEGHRRHWCAEVSAQLGRRSDPPLAQAEVLGVLDGVLDPSDVVIGAAGSLPGDLHKLWRPTDPKSYHLEYGYSCMGYEIAAGVGVKMAAPDRSVYVLVGDGSYMMMAQEIVTAVQEGLRMTVVLLDNHGFSSIGGLSESVGAAGFGTEYRHRADDGQLSGETLPIDFAANAQSLGAHAIRATTRQDLEAALTEAKGRDAVTVIVVETARSDRVPGYGSWWDVPPLEVSDEPDVQQARSDWAAAVKRRRIHL